MDSIMCSIRRRRASADSSGLPASGKGAATVDCRRPHLRGVGVIAQSEHLHPGRAYRSLSTASLRGRLG
jgi:hypothetical protein